LLTKTFSRRWYQNLQAQALVLFIVLGVILALVTWVVVTTQGEHQFARYEQDRLLLNGEALVKDLGQSVRAVETTARAIALLGAQSKPDSNELARLVPALLNAGDAKIITGGGLWPEPYSVDPEHEKNSLFWGRNAQGELTFYDDYNRPEASPYFREEWYVPATYLNADQAYWSRSYIDPYSHEPMATCTVPYFRAGRVAGVATVDITLAGLNKYFEARIDRQGMYIFAVDHTNHFLNYPQRSLIQPDSTNIATGVQRFISVAELAVSQDGFRAMADTLDSLLAVDIRQQQQAHAKIMPRITWEMDQRIIGLAPHEAETIAATLLDLADDIEVDGIITEFDTNPITGEPSTAVILGVPRAGWKVVAVIPSSLVHARVNTLVVRMGRVFLGSLLAIVLLSFFGVRYFFLDRMSDLVRILQDKSHDLVAELENHVSHNPNEVGELAFWFADNTRDLQAAQKRAEKAALTRSSFLANMSHEIRTPMNGILGAANLLAEPDDPLELDKVMIIRRSAEALLAILNDILDFSRMEAGQFSIDESPFELVETVEGCRGLVENLATAKNLPLRFTNQLADQCPVVGDSGRLRQIILNLLTNAIKFTSEGHIEIVLRTGTGRATAPGKKTFCIEVRDTGMGIAAEYQEAIFSMFEQVDSAPVRRAGGTGLGLAISRQLSRLMGGELTVASTLGEGAVFRLVLDLAVDTDERITPDPEVADEPPLGLDILLVEDNPTNRLVAHKFLDRLGCTVTEACDGEEAVAATARREFDAILMDLQMPRMDGLTATRRIRTMDGPCRRVPIIPVTANTLPEDRANCLDAGMNDFLAKPVSQRDLRQTLIRWVPIAASLV